jgi:hypothetical protein
MYFHLPHQSQNNIYTTEPIIDKLHSLPKQEMQLNDYKIYL